MDLRKLQHATMLATERNFARAAARLHITQSALSQSIARLEAEAGFALFDRDRSGANPTSAGRSFLVRAEALLLHARGLEHETSLLRGCNTGTVAFGFGPVPASTLLIPVLAALAREHPAITSNVKVADGRALLEDLIAERIEFFVAASGTLRHRSDIALAPVASFRIGFFVRRKHALTAEHAVSMQDILAFPLLSPHIADIDQGETKKRFGLSPGQPWPPTIFCDDIEALRRLALQSDGVLFGPHAAVAADCVSGRLVELQPKGTGKLGNANVAIVTLGNRSLSPAAAMVISRLKALVQEQGVAARK
jgi:DNA-binding transcriptional LysR family regulator